MSAEDTAKLNAMLGLGEANAAQQPAATEQPEPEQPDVDDDLDATEDSDETLETDDSGEPEISSLSEADLDKTVTLRDGREISVAEAVAGYMRNDHHTQTLQQSAKTRQSYTQAIQLLGALEQAGRAILDPDLQAFKNMNMNALEYQDPQRYRQIKPAYDAVMARKAQYDATVQQIGQSLIQGVQAAEESVWKEVETDLGYSIAGFNDDRFAGMKDYVQKMGFAEEEVSLMADPRIWRIVDKAKQFDDLKNGKVSNKPKSAKRPTGQRSKGKVTKDSASRQQQRLQQRARAGDKAANMQLLRGMIKL